jgi:PAS domain S-box-containing protein
MFGFQLRLSQKGILLAAVPLLCEILLIAVLSFIIIPFGTRLRQAALEYSTGLAIANLRNDIILLQNTIDSPIRSKNYMSPDWILKWTKETQKRFSKTSGVAADVMSKDAAEAWGLASEQPTQFSEMPDTTYRYWSSSAMQHLADLTALSAGDQLNEQYVNQYKSLLARFSNSVQAARSALLAGKQDDAIACTAQARLAIKRADYLILKQSNEVAQRSENAIRTGASIDNKELQSVQLEFRNVLLGGLAANLVPAFLLILLFSYDTKSRLSYVMTNMDRLSRKEPLKPTLGGKDELQEIDQAFHDMADALETARRKEQAIVENASDIICSLNEENRFERINPAAAKIWGFQPDELANLDVLAITAPEDQEVTIKALQSLRQQELPMSFENTVVRRDNSRVSMHWSCRWSEQSRLILCVARDIEQQKAIARMKQDFITMISTDLRKPLAANEEFLRRLMGGEIGELTEDGRVKTEKSVISARRLLNLVNDLLDVEQLSAGKLDLNLEEIGSTELLQRSIDAVSFVADGKGIRLVTVGEDVKLSVDVDRIVQVLVNLLGNAIKFSPNNSEITLSARALGNSVQFRVQDQGRGIPESMRKAVFERFQQVTKTDATEKGGTGLGLAICKMIVESHGGEIGVDSEEGQGSTFWFTV